MLAVLLNGQEMLRSRWVKNYKPVFHQPGDYMPDFLKPKASVVDLDAARKAAATAAKTAKAAPVPPPDVLNKKWAALVAMKTARAQKAKQGKRKQA